MRGETRIPGLRRVLHILTRGGIARDVDEEIGFHLDARAEELMRLGASERDARQRARGEYGDVEDSRRELLRVNRRRLGNTEREELLMSFIDDIRYAARGIARRPALVVVTTSVLCIGIAANAVMFGVVDQLLLRPPAGIASASELRRVYVKYASEPEPFAVYSYPVVTALQRSVPEFAEVGAFYRGTHSMGRGAEARSVEVEMVTGNYFSLLGVRPAMGRAFAPGEDSIPRGERVAVVSHGFWTGVLASDSAVVGRALELSGNTFTVIGVAPNGFSGLDRRNVDLWVPISAMASDGFGADWYASPGSWWVQAVGRLRSGAQQVAETQATAAYRALTRDWNKPDSTSNLVLGSIIGSRMPNAISAEARISLWLMGVSLVVLLIACANVANLLIARTIERRREIAVRLALGVSRARLLRMLLTESALLAMIAGGAALAVAYWAGRLVQNLLLPGIVWSGNVLDARVLAFTLGVTALCIVLAGVAPALQSIGMRVSDALKAGSRSVAGGPGRLRHALLVAQAALSIVLLIGAGLFVRSLDRVVGRDVGIDVGRVMMVTMDLASAGFDGPRVTETFASARDRVSAMPGIEHATVVKGSVPLRTGSTMEFRVPGVESLPEFELGGPYGAGIEPAYFATLGTRVVRGRNFTEQEARTPSRVMIINQLVADTYWPGSDPVGQCVIHDEDAAGACTEIVGIVENVMLFSMIQDRAMVYVPTSHPSIAEQQPRAMLVRASGDPGALLPLVQREIQGLAPNMPHVRVRPFSDLVAPQLRPWRLGATMFALFGAIALIIAAVGLYSVLAYWVSQRTHEIGVRMALGARRGDIVRLVAWQTSRSVGLGLLIGVSAAILASRWVADMLYGTSPREPAVYLAAALVLAVAALTASVIPARRSTGVDPARALRAD